MLGDPSKHCPSCFHMDRTEPTQTGHRALGQQYRGPEGDTGQSQRNTFSALGNSQPHGPDVSVRSEDTDMLRGRESIMVLS